MMAFDEATLHFYASEAPVYTASGKDGSFKHLEPFLDRLPAGASILELGCGGGYDAAFMLARGFDVHATDGVPEMADTAEARIGRPVAVMRFDQLDAEEQFDAVVAAAALLHVPRDSLGDVLGRVWRALKPGGWHIASFKAGGTEGRDRLGRHFNYLSPQQAEQYYREAGDWQSLEIAASIGGGYDGAQGPWIAVTVQKHA